MAERNKFFLDTHVWLWFMNGDFTLSSTIEGRLTAAAERGDLFVSAISVWEVAQLEATGKITLKVPLRKWIDKAISAPQVTLKQTTPEIMIESCHLPGDTTPYEGLDYVDRLIIATARSEGGILVSRNPDILRYGEEQHGVRVLEA
ncbi:MAG: type II toxin-antitoxin system VapC family toxin [Alphaproteobacteria bacterium]